MKRLDLIKAAPLGLLAACAGGSLLSPSGGTIVPARLRPHVPHQGPCQNWNFVWGPMAKDGGHGYAEAYYRPDCASSYSLVGGIYLDFLINKGGYYIRQDISFTAGGHTATYQLSDLMSTFGPGKIVQLFKQWYWQVNNSGRGGTMYDANGRVRVISDSTKYFQTTTITAFFPGSGGSSQWYYDWGTTWQGSPGLMTPDITIGCAGALAAEFGCSVGWVLAAIGSISGPLEWLGFAGVTAALFGSAALVLSECNK